MANYCFNFFLNFNRSQIRFSARSSPQIRCIDCWDKPVEEWGRQVRISSSRQTGWEDVQRHGLHFRIEPSVETGIYPDDFDEWRDPRGCPLLRLPRQIPKPSYRQPDVVHHRRRLKRREIGLHQSDKHQWFGEYFVSKVNVFQSFPCSIRKYNIFLVVHEILVIFGNFYFRISTSAFTWKCTDFRPHVNICRTKINITSGKRSQCSTWLRWRNSRNRWAETMN